MLDRARHVVRAQATECLFVFEKRGLVLAGVLPERGAGFADAFDDFVLDVGDVHNVSHGVAFELEIAPDQVGEDKRAKIADVCEVVHRRPTAVHPHFLARRIERDEFAHRTRQRVEESQTHAAVDGLQ